MALGDTYATLDELKAYLSLSGQSAVDDQMQDALLSASREIERHCNRQFNKAASATARVYQAKTSGATYVDDFYSTTGFIVKTDDAGDGTFETTWLSSDYELFPLNGVVNGVTGWPQWKVSAAGTQWFPVWDGTNRKARVEVTALWGWTDVPSPVKQACLLLAAENFQLKDAPLGVAGMGEFGVVRVRNNRMAIDKLAKYCREPVLVG